MSNHTPGPWKCVESNSARTFNQISIRPVRPVIKGLQLPLAKVMRGDLFEYGGGDGQANARLIAAAPELMTALQMLYDETADYIRLNNLGGMDNQCMQLARAALARAVGAA